MLSGKLYSCRLQSSSSAPLQGQSNLEEHQRVHDAVVRKSSEVLAQFVELQERCNQLVGEVEAVQGQLAQSQGDLHSEQQAHQAANAAWDLERGQLQVGRRTLTSD